VLKAFDFPFDGKIGEIKIDHEAERQLLLACSGFPIAVQLAVNRYQPKEIAEFAFSVAQAFSRFYAECQVVQNGKVNASRMAICQFVDAILTKCLYLLGIEVPGRM
jgi:arginyl-tRNA synthetase